LIDARAVVAALALTVATAAGAQRSAERLKDVEQRIRQTEGEAKALESKSTSVLGQVDELDRAIGAQERTVADLAAQMRSARTRKETAERAIARLDEQLPELRASFTARARGLYRLTRRGLAPLVVRAPQEWSEALRYRRGLQAVVAHDHGLVDALVRNRAAADAAREEARAQAEALAAERAQNERELGSLRATRKQKQQLLASIRHQTDKRAELLEELESSAEKLRQLIEKEEAAKAAPFQPPPGQAATMASPLRIESTAVATARNGVEIRAAAGTPVRAVKARRVVFAGWFTGYGKMVILDHGDRLYSVYGYVGDVLVETGRAVGAGETIAAVGTTGPVAVPSLYFEIRDHGTPRDPAAYIKSLAHK